MEYQYSGPGGANMSEREDRNELCTVGTVLASERRKSVVTTDYSCTSATHTTLPSTSPDVAAAASPRVSGDEDDYSLVRAQPGKDVLMVPATPTATPTATPATTERMSAATLTTTLVTEMRPTTSATAETRCPTTSTATPATTERMSAATLTTTLVTDMHPTTSATTETLRPTTPTATSATTELMFPATPTATSATTEKLLTATEAATTTTAALRMTTTLPLTTPTTMRLDEGVHMPAERCPAGFSDTETPPEAVRQIIAQMNITGDEKVDQPGEEEVLDNEYLEEWEQPQSHMEEPGEWELIPTDQWTETGPEFEDVVADKLNHLSEEDLEPTGETPDEIWSEDDEDVKPGRSSDPTTERPGTSSDPTPQPMTDNYPTDDEDEQFSDALSSQTSENLVQHPSESVTEQHGYSNASQDSNVATDEVPPAEIHTAMQQDTATPNTPYKLRQRAPVDYRKLHLGAITQTATDLLTKMSQQQLENVEDMEGDPPLDEYVQQVFDTFKEETEANATIPVDTVTTPEPCNTPEKTLAGIVNCIRYAARGDLYMTRASNGHTAIMAMLRVTRWIPQYQRIAAERDRLLEREEELREERDQLFKDRAEAWIEIQRLKGQRAPETVEPPAAKPTGDSTAVKPNSRTTQSHAEGDRSSVRSAQAIPAKLRTAKPGKSGHTSPVPSTSRARSVTPESPQRRSPSQPISPFGGQSRSPPPKTRRGSKPLSRSSSPGDEVEESYLPTPLREPQVMIRSASSSPKVVPKLVLKNLRARQHDFVFGKQKRIIINL
ncbi:hypothetical protein GE061_013697 [Apolygus lucorum]|uniref:Uncharacterized protein n=1 Tax=Apolygus lucorum TaxID=248454 RepID=A0A8S9XQK0_APOLU|nr:hypothetical protein GE061_013697 [Apolygus lucorum]